MDWKDQIAGCFGVADVKFALHASDAQRAYELLGRLIKGNVSWGEVHQAFRAFLNQKVTDQGHIQEQMNRVTDHFRAWLDDPSEI
jgi:hypothetical protein